MNCAAVIARDPAGVGVGHVFGYRGDPNIDLIETLRVEELEFVLARRERTAVLMTNGLSSMGFALPVTMAAKMLVSDRAVVCFTGDGGFAMVQG